MIAERIIVGTKQFAQDARGYVLMGDERDIGVATWDRDAVWTWCENNGINIEYQGTLAGTDVWRVRDEKQRVMFILRWS